MATENYRSEISARPILALGKDDVGNLDTVLRGYYLSQIKSLKKRKDRKLARQLLQNHLILPKSRQRTSKDTAYIQEVLGMEESLLKKLEESRLIRRIQNSGGNNPIFEISHDTLVEPILAEKRDRLAIAAFIKKTWKYVALLLLFWFVSGMIFQDAFEVVPDLFRKPKVVELHLETQTVGIDENSGLRMLSLPPFLLDQEIKPIDSIRVTLPLQSIDLARLREATSSNATSGNTSSNEADTISIFFANPIELPVGPDGVPEPYQAFSNVVVPLTSGTDDIVYARVSGSLRMTSDERNNSPVMEYNQRYSLPIEIELGDTLVQAGQSTQSVPVNFSFLLTDLFEDETDKNNIRNIIGDRPVTLNYAVKVRPNPVAPPQVKIEYPAVQGIEVQYSDGTKSFLKGDPNNAGGNETVHVVVAGETLFSIAKKYGVVDQFGNTSAQAIKDLNGLQGNAISVGQTLRIPNR